MVFSGRPSAACDGCRRRRIKCDKKQPNCSQCLRKCLKCSGYRDLGALRLRDETTRVMSKVQANSTRSLSPYSSSSGSSAEYDFAIDTPTLFLEDDLSPSTMSLLETLPIRQKYSPSPGLLQSEPVFLQPLKISKHDLSMAYFMKFYIVTSPFEAYLPEMFRNPSDSSLDDPCHSAAVAAAYATLGLHSQNSDLWRLSQKEYAQALTRLHKSLADPERAKSDRTLGAVLLLGLFEAVMYQGGRSPTGWAAHTSGSLELLRLRGKEQFQSHVSAQLFAHASTNIKTSCMQRGVRIPTELLRLGEEARVYINRHDPAVLLAPIIHELSHFLNQHPGRSCLSWAYECHRLDKKVKTFIQIAIPDKSPYAMQNPVQSTHPWAYEGKEARHTNLRHIKVWNILRLLRISLITHIDINANGIVDVSDDSEYTQDEAPPPAASHNLSVEDLKAYARREIFKVAEQVLAVIPSFMEQDEPPLNQWRFSSPARSLVWPLSLLERSHICPPVMFEYISACLQQIALDLHIASAVRVAREVDTTTDWLHLFHLG